MKFPIDVLFIDKDYRVVKIFENQGSWKITRLIFKAYGVLELEAGTVKKENIVEGDKLSLEVD